MCFARKIAIVALSFLCLQPAQANAGCGCEKPPPAISAIRPAFASPGDEVVIFAPGIEVGVVYTVTFRSAVEVSVSARAKLRRDLADGILKPQLVVEVPDLPLGPTSVTVSKGASVFLEVQEHDFTMLQEAIALTEANRNTIATCYRAAVGADSTVYIPVDVSAIDDRMIFFGRADGYRLMFGSDDIAIYNTQGVLMQLLGPDQAEIYAIYDEGQGSSFTLAYDRHEFQTYRALHENDPDYASDGSDPEWHANGSRHTDHNHLVIAVSGLVNGEDLPLPGQTPEFTFIISTWLGDAADGGPVQPTLVQDGCGTDDAAPNRLRGRRGNGEGRGGDRGGSDGRRGNGHDDGTQEGGTGGSSIPLGQSGSDDSPDEDGHDGSVSENDGNTGGSPGDQGSGAEQDDGDGESTVHSGAGDDGASQPTGALCAATPPIGCRIPIQRGKSQLLIRDKNSDGGDVLVWKWTKGESTEPGDFGNVMTTDRLTLCLYDESGDPPRLVFEATAEAASACSGNSAGQSCWRGLGKHSGGYKQFKYRNKSRTPDGIEQVILKPGSRGKSKLLVKGKGENLDLPMLPLGLPLRMQLQAQTGNCWEAVYSETGARKNDAQEFSGRAN